MKTATHHRTIRSPISPGPAARPLGNAFGLLAIFLLLGCHKSAQPPAAETPAAKVDGDKITMPASSPQRTALSVEAAQPHKSPTAQLTGRLMWNDDVTVRVYTPFGGRVETIETDLGAQVAAGTVLARIASPDLGQAQADTRRAAGDLQLAQRNLTRARELFDHGAAAKKDVESAEADLTRAISENDRASARLKLYSGNEASIDQVFPLKTPIGGMVVEKNISPGQEVRPDQMLGNDARIFAPLFVVSDPTRLWLQLDVTESNLGLLKTGQAIRVSNKAFPGKTFEGRLEFIGNSIDPTTRTVKIRAVVSNPDKLLKAEMYVIAELAEELADNTDPGVDVAAKAVFMKDNQHYLFVEQKPGQFERRLVQPGAEHEGRILVKGLTAGENVVTEGCLLLQALIDSASDKS